MGNPLHGSTLLWHNPVMAQPLYGPGLGGGGMKERSWFEGRCSPHTFQQLAAVSHDRIKQAEVPPARPPAPPRPAPPAPRTGAYACACTRTRARICARARKQAGAFKDGCVTISGAAEDSKYYFCHIDNCNECAHAIEHVVERVLETCH